MVVPMVQKVECQLKGVNHGNYDCDRDTTSPLN